MDTDLARYFSEQTVSRPARRQRMIQRKCGHRIYLRPHLKLYQNMDMAGVILNTHPLTGF